MNDWKRLFKPWILARGYEYYLDDTVLNLDQSNDIYTACVTGSEDYEVFIEVKDGYVHHMSCTCSYACDGENCKHMAAVLYEINDGEDKKDDEDTSDIDEDNVNNIIETLNEFELKSALHEIIHNSSEAYSLFQNKFMKRIVGNTNILSCVKDVFMEYDNYIDYEEAFDFHDELDAQIDNIKVLVNHARYQEAYTCAKYIIEQSQYLEIDDSAGCWYMDLLECFEIIHDILSKKTIINNNILPWLSQIMNMPNLFFEDKILDILEEFQDIGELLHNKIAAMKEDTEKYYNIDMYLDKMYTYLKSHDKSVIEFISENMENSIVRRRYIEDLMIQEKYQEHYHYSKKVVLWTLIKED